MTPPLRVILVDDEPLAIERLRMLLARCDGVDVVGTAGTGSAALELVTTVAPDTCLLDIGMPGMDGIALATALTALPDPPNFVFVTAFDQYAVAAFEIAAVDYLVKPVDPRRLEQALERARRGVAATRQDRSAGKGVAASRQGRDERSGDAAGYLTEFWAPDHQGFTRIGVEVIDRIVAERDYMRLHVGTRSWLINESLARLEAKLDPHSFVRLHRSAIIRRAFIAGFRHDDGEWIARLEDGTEQKVGRLYLDNARAIAGRGRPARPDGAVR